MGPAMARLRLRARRDCRAQGDHQQADFTAVFRLPRAFLQFNSKRRGIDALVQNS